MAQAYVYEDDATGWRHIVAGDIPTGAGSPLTTKGDLYGFSTANDRIPVGADGTVLTADSTQALGVKWSAGAGGGVASVTAADTSIVIGGTAANPTVATGTLDVIASDHPAAADWSNNSHKITSVTDPTNAQDAATKNYVDSAVSGAAGSGLRLIYSTTLAAVAATIDTGANGIPTGHGDLIVVLYARSDSAVANGDSVRFTFNGDGAAHYDTLIMRNLAGTLGSANQIGVTTGGIMCQIPTDTLVANYFGSGRMTIPAYDSTVAYKSVESTGGFMLNTLTNSQVATITNSWRNTAAINQMTMALGSGANFKIGTHFAIYGTV